MFLNYLPDIFLSTKRIYTFALVLPVSKSINNYVRCVSKFLDHWPVTSRRRPRRKRSKVNQKAWLLIQRHQKFSHQAMRQILSFSSNSFLCVCILYLFTFSSFVKLSLSQHHSAKMNVISYSCEIEKPIFLMPACCLEQYKWLQVI